MLRVSFLLRRRLQGDHIPQPSKASQIQRENSSPLPVYRIGTSNNKVLFSSVLGIILLIIGIVIMLIIGCHEWLDTKHDTDFSSLMSIGFLLIMLGIAFYFPDLLKSGATDNTSSMRVAVYMIVCVFVLLCVKYGWNCKNFNDLKLDSTWAYILGVALGSKAVQTFGESKNPKAAQGNTPTSDNTGPNALIHDASNINNRPPNRPPF